MLQSMFAVLGFPLITETQADRRGNILNVFIVYSRIRIKSLFIIIIVHLTVLTPHIHIVIFGHYSFINIS